MRIEFNGTGRRGTGLHSSERPVGGAGGRAWGLAGRTRSKLARVGCHRGLAEVAVLGLILNRLVDLATVDGHILWGFDAQSHLVTADLDHSDRDVIVDDDALVLLAGENQHRRSPLKVIPAGRSHTEWVDDCDGPGPR